MLIDEAQRIHVLNQGLAVLAHAHHGLHLALANMAMQRNAMLLRQITAAAEETIRAMMRDGRGNGGADILARPAPMVCPVFTT
jgi:hypothetical protein